MRSEPAVPTDNIQSTLTERGARYGDFSGHAAFSEALIHFIEHGNLQGTPETSWSKMSPVQRQALRVIADKIARILNGDPNYDDNWRDIAGYATLVLERLPK